MRYFILALCGLLCAAGCIQRSTPGTNTPANPSQTMEAVATTQPPADFMAFYEQFHTDSLYQIAHIAWPMQGETSEQIDSTHHRKKMISWEKENWRMHRPVDLSSGDFKREFEMLGDVLVIERIFYAAANYGLERRFARNDKNEWEMIFYSDMQEIKK